MSTQQIQTMTPTRSGYNLWVDFLTSWITFLFNGFHELDKKWWSSIRGANCSARSGEWQLQTKTMLWLRLIEGNPMQTAAVETIPTRRHGLQSGQQQTQARMKESAWAGPCVRRLLLGHHPPALPLPTGWAAWDTPAAPLLGHNQKAPRSPDPLPQAHPSERRPSSLRGPAGPRRGWGGGKWAQGWNGGWLRKVPGSTEPSQVWTASTCHHAFRQNSNPRNQNSNPASWSLWRYSCQRRKMEPLLSNCLLMWFSLSNIQMQVAWASFVFCPRIHKCQAGCTIKYRARRCPHGPAIEMPLLAYTCFGQVIS